jgi:hypothetical protein
VMLRIRIPLSPKAPLNLHFQIGNCSGVMTNQPMRLIVVATDD